MGTRENGPRPPLRLVRLRHHVGLLDQLCDIPLEPIAACRVLAAADRRPERFDRYPAAAALIDAALIGLFGVQHSLMARPWFKEWWAASIPLAYERCTYVHMANLALFAVIVFWQPIPAELWTVSDGFWRDVLWAAFAAGWVILFVGARSFGILDLLGVEQMQRWCNGEAARQPRLKTGLLYGWLRHPMYVGVLLGVWTTPRMTVGHALLAFGLTGYVLIAMRYEERDLVRRFGTAYDRWRSGSE